MTTHPIVNGVQLTDAQERRIRQIDYLLKKAMFLDKADAELAQTLARIPKTSNATKHNGQTLLLCGPTDQVNEFVRRDNSRLRPPPSSYYDKYGDFEFEDEY